MQNEKIQERKQRIRHLFLELKAELSDQLRDGREKSLVNTKIDEAMLWAVEAIHKEEVDGVRS